MLDVDIFLYMKGMTKFHMVLSSIHTYVSSPKQFY